MYEYACKVVRVVDGDTVVCNVDLGFTVQVEVTFRLLGINTPEVIGESKQKGLAAKAETKRLLSLGSVTVKSEKPLKTDKYGRWLGTFFVHNDGSTLEVNKTLVESGFAVPFMV